MLFNYTKPDEKIKAAAYVRMSTEHQKYSPENQMAAIREYANKHNYEIIQTYSDEGKSGLNIAGRASLQRMINDVESRSIQFKAILVLDVSCLLSTDDEGFTYNKHVNRLSNVQEHKMIVKAIERGVPIERLAKVLDMDPANVIRKKNLLDGIDPKASELLKDKIISGSVFTYLKKMRPQRQVEAANLMNDMGNYTAKFARSIWLASSDKQLLNPLKRANTLDVEKLGRLESEVSKVQGEYKIMEDKYGIDVLNLTLVKGYIRSIFANQRVCDYLKAYEPDIYRQFETIVELENINALNDRPF